MLLILVDRRYHSHAISTIDVTLQHHKEGHIRTKAKSLLQHDKHS